MTLTDCNGFDIETGDSLRCRACNGRLFDLKAGAKICTHWRDGRGAGEFEIVGRPTGPPAPPGINVLLRGDGMPKEGKTVTIDIGFIMGAKRNPDVPEVRTVSSEAEYRELYGRPCGLFREGAACACGGTQPAHWMHAPAFCMERSTEPVQVTLRPEVSLDHCATRAVLASAHEHLRKKYGIPSESEARAASYRGFSELVRKTVSQLAPKATVTTDFCGLRLDKYGPCFIAWIDFGHGVSVDYAWPQTAWGGAGIEIDLRELIKEAQLEIGQRRTR